MVYTWFHLKTAKCAQKPRCQCGLEAKRAEEGPFAVEVCSKAINYGDVMELKVGPWPTEVESALLLTQAAYTKAQCLSWDIEDQGLLRLGLRDLFLICLDQPLDPGIGWNWHCNCVSTKLVS